MTDEKRDEPRGECDDERKAAADHAEDLDIPTDDAAGVTGGIANSLLWVGSRSGGS